MTTLNRCALWAVERKSAKPKNNDILRQKDKNIAREGECYVFDIEIALRRHFFNILANESVKYTSWNISYNRKKMLSQLNAVKKV